MFSSSTKQQPLLIQSGHTPTDSLAGLRPYLVDSPSRGSDSNLASRIQTPKGGMVLARHSGVCG